MPARTMRTNAMSISSSLSRLSFPVLEPEDGLTHNDVIAMPELRWHHDVLSLNFQRKQRLSLWTAILRMQLDDELPVSAGDNRVFVMDPVIGYVDLHLRSINGAIFGELAGVAGEISVSVVEFPFLVMLSV